MASKPEPSAVSFASLRAVPSRQRGESEVTARPSQSCGDVSRRRSATTVQRRTITISGGQRRSLARSKSLKSVKPPPLLQESGEQKAPTGEEGARASCTASVEEPVRRIPNVPSISLEMKKERRKSNSAKLLSHIISPRGQIDTDKSPRGGLDRSGGRSSSGRREKESSKKEAKAARSKVKRETKEKRSRLKKSKSTKALRGENGMLNIADPTKVQWSRPSPVAVMDLGNGETSTLSKEELVAKLLSKDG